MKKIIICLFIIVLNFTILGCTNKPETNVLNVKVESGVTASLDTAYTKYNLKDSNNNDLGNFALYLGQVSTDNNGVVSILNNEPYSLTVNLAPDISGENLKCYYNDNLLEITTYDSYYNQYNYNFTSATEHNIRVEGISKDVKRKFTVTVPISTTEYTVFYNDTEINEDNNDVVINYGNDLIIKVKMLINAEPGWTIAYQKEGHSYDCADAEKEIQINNDNSKTFTIKMDYKIIRMEMFAVIPIQ